MDNIKNTQIMRFTKDTKLDLNFYQLPVFLFDEEFKDISNDSKILYAIIKDMYNLSLINNWIDKDNKIYIYLQQKEMCTLMNRSKSTIKNAVQELINNNLIEISKAGFDNKRKIYVKYKNYEKTNNIEDISTNRMYFSKNDLMNTIYYPLQKDLFTDKYKKMSNDTKVLLAILTSRQSLSQSNANNGKWTNEDGEIYFKYSRVKMCKIMNRSENTIRSYINELIKFKLLQEELSNKKSFNKSKALYIVYNIEESKEKTHKELSTGFKASKINGGLEIEGSEDQKLRVRKTRNCGFGEPKIEGSEDQKLRANYTDINYTNSNNTNFKSSHVMSESEKNKEQDLVSNKTSTVNIARDKEQDIASNKINTVTKLTLNDKQKTYLKIIKENIEYTTLNSRINKELADDFIKIMISYITEVQNSSITINKNDYTLESVKNRLLKLNQSHFEHAYFKFIQVENTINNKDKYILSCLFNSYTESSAYISNIISRDFGYKYNLRK